jgi:hypothetical protein
MGRPRKEFHRLTRTVTARVLDEQYDWLVEQAIAAEHGDLSKSIRDAIDSARVMETLLSDPEPLERFREMLERSESEAEYDEVHDE